MNTKLQEDLAVLIGLTLIEAVRGAGPLGIPSGHLYARVMNYCTVAALEDILKRLVKMGALRQTGPLYFLGEVAK